MVQLMVAAKPGGSTEPARLAVTDVTAELARRPRWRLAFPLHIETLFDDTTRLARIFHFRLLVSLGLLAYFSYAAVDDFVFLELGAFPVLLRVATVLPAGLFFLCFVHRMSARFREGLAAAAMILVIFVTISLLAVARSEASAYGMFCALMVSMFGTVALRLRFPYAACFASAKLVAVATMLSIRSDFPNGLKAIVVISILTCTVFGLVANWQLERAERRAFLLNLLEKLRGDQLSQNAVALSELIRIDPLTKLANRRAFDDRLAELRSERQTFSLLMVDVDYFKLYNDRYGHLAGDECLHRVGRILVEGSARAGDLVARFGGEEFVVLLADCQADEAGWVAESIRRIVAEVAIPHRGRSDDVDHLTVSIGVATASVSDPQSAESILEVADRRLYACKRRGRNCVLGESESSLGNMAA